MDLLSKDRSWQFTPRNPKLLNELSENFHYPELITNILLGRGIDTAARILNYIKPSTLNFYSPFYFKDMGKAVDRIEKAINEHQGILIFGDKDADGVTATAILYKYLQRLDANVVYRVPEGSENYGISKDVIGWAAINDFSLIITVDCGITSIAEIEYANSIGMEVIITDHHEARENHPAAYAVINPKISSDCYPFAFLSGASVAFKLVCGLAEKSTLSETYNIEIVFFDIETTGLNLSKDEIIEIGAIKVINGVKISEFQALIKPSSNISAEITALTGITNEMLEKDGKPVAEVLEKFVRFIEGCRLVGHNSIEFDLKFIERELKKYLKICIGNPVEDTLKMSRVMIKKISDYKLSTVAKFLGLYPEPGKLHRSLFDSYVCSEVYRSLIINRNTKLIELYEEYLPLAAIGTIADIMPLVDENRNIVKNGLRLLPHTSIGLITLLREINMNIEKVKSRDISWNVSPILNSPGRVGDASLSVELLISNKVKESEELVQAIISKDTERKNIVDDGIEIINKMLELNSKAADRVFFISSDRFSKGTTGLLANRFSNLYTLPVVIIAIDRGFSTGSIRAPNGFDVIKMLDSLKDLVVQFGGHKSAGGFTIKTENIETFREKIVDYMDRLTTEDLKRELIVDAVIEDPGDLNLSMIRYLENVIEPTGNGNEIPRLLMKGVKIVSNRDIGRNSEHILMTIQRNGKSLTVTGWNWAKKIRIIATGTGQEAFFDLIVTPEINKYQGNEELRLNLIDIKRAI
ncbi:MAG: single-stranded-DNA-specific exonuclease RecJ [Brevinematales bacterium]